MYNQFYFLHLNKTINASVDLNIMHSLYKVMDRHSIHTSLNLNHNDHNMWRNFEDTTYIFSVFRNPVDRTLADFTYSHIFDDFHIRKISSNGVHVDDNLMPSVEEFEKWLYTIHTPNYQSRALHNGLVNVSPDLISNRVKRINLLVRDNAFNQDSKQKLLTNKILSDIGIKENIKTPWVPEHLFAQRHAGAFYYNKIIGTSLEQEIKKLNWVDVNLYENDSNFHLL